MFQDRLAGFFGNGRVSNEMRETPGGLHGFTANPIGNAITPAQAMLYQAAFLQAQKDLEEPEWPLAECWN